MITFLLFARHRAHPRKRRALSAAAFLSAVSLLAAVSSSGASTQVWELSEYKDFLRGRFENVSLLPPGTLTPAPKLVDLFTSDQPVIWTVAIAPDGTTYVGTGHQGRVYRLDADGKVSLFWSAPEIEVFALAVGPEGEVYAGASPNGKLYRITAEGEGEEIFDPEQTYIWSLVIAPASGSNNDKAPLLYMATGGEGRIYRVDASGKGRVFAETKQRHVVSLALDAEGRLLAGTDPNGIAYRIDPDGRLFALYDADLPEIRSLAVAPNGDIYAAAMGGGASKITQSVSSFAASAAVKTTVQVSAAAGGAAAPATPSSGTVAAQPMVSVSQPVISYPGMERSALLRIRPGQGVEKLWSSSEENILALSVANDEAAGTGDQRESSPPQILFATDRKGRIYKLRDRRKVSLVTESGREQVTQLATDSKGLLVASAHSAGLSRFETTAEAAGTYESAIHDAKTHARWGRLTWQGDGVDSGRVKIATRAGNAAVPDDSWSEWSEAIEGEADAEGPGTFAGTVRSPPARYIQWRATLATKDERAPLLRAVRLAYLPRNSPPRVSELKVEASAEKGAATAAGAATPAAAPAEAAYSITVSASGSSTAAPATSTTQQTLGGAGRGMKISWKATDPDGDKLTAAVAFRETGVSGWKTIKKEINDSHVSLDSESLADGTYRFRVVVSDRAANPPAAARETDQISEPVLIDHTPPRVRMIDVNGRESASFEATDDASALAAAEYAIDAGNWIPVYPADGILDSRRESFTIPLDGLAEGEHLLTLRVRDRAGNAGLGKATIR